jgi:hypothetical protein
VVIGDQFTIERNELPQYVLDAADAEARAIYESDYADNHSLSGRPRTFDDIRKDTLLGKIGEYILMLHFNYTNDDAKWHDLISPGGTRTEVKTWRKNTMTESGTEREVSKLRRRKSATRQWFFSTKVIVISYDTETNVFTIESIHNI